VWRYTFTSLYVFITRWLIKLRDTFYFFLTTNTVYCSGWFDGAGDGGTVPFNSVLFSFMDVTVDGGMASCKSSTK
jgi:hypothetical protein